jgi:signal transduction histidine kinase/ActR/RegA family two-component response regulator
MKLKKPFPRAVPAKTARGPATRRHASRRAATALRKARAERDELMAQMREANSRLIVSTVRAQTLTEEAEQANRVKDEFLATVSHELRTPLNAVLGWARMLASMELPPERMSHGIGIIERNALALARLIEDLLDVSRIVAGTLRLTPLPIDLIAVTYAAIETAGSLAHASGVTLTFSPDAREVEPVSGDAARLQQVIGNLVSNAIKFTPAGGRVDVRVSRAADHMQIQIADTGQGISPDFLPHVFERFRQAEGAPTRRHGGLGVGLAIVRQLVELHGGTVTAASAGTGKGATFTVCLPIATGVVEAHQAMTGAERRTAKPPVPVSPPPPRLDALRILVIDDDADGRALTAMVLAQAGATVDAAASAAEALRILGTNQPDVLVTDIRLPDEDGYGLIRQIREHEAEHGGFLPAVALTGYTRAEDKAEALAAGFQAHLPKPIEPVALTAALAALVPQPKPER